MENTSTEKSHSTDYHDGGDTHYLGNEDYPNGNNVAEQLEKNSNKLDGKVAEGNDLVDEKTKH